MPEDKLFRHIGGGWQRIALFVSGVPSYFNKIYTAGKNSYNPFEGTCSCDFFLEHLNKYEPLDVRLLCRHLQKFYGSRIFENSDSVQKCIITSGRNYSGGEFFQKDDIYLFFKPGGDWCEFFVRQPHWIRFSYNFLRYRWAFGRKPEREIVVPPQ